MDHKGWPENCHKEAADKITEIVSLLKEID